MCTKFCSSSTFPPPRSRWPFSYESEMIFSLIRSPFTQPRVSGCLLTMGYPNWLGGTLGLACCHCGSKSLARSWVLAQFPRKCWLRPSSLSATHGAGWLLAGRPVEGTTRLTVTPQALQGWGLLAMGRRQGCGQRLPRAGLGLPGRRRQMCCLHLPPATVGSWGIMRGFICLSPHPLLPGSLASSGLQGSAGAAVCYLQFPTCCPWEAAEAKAVAALPMPRVPQMVTAFAAFFSPSTIPAQALCLLQLTPLPLHPGRFVLPWGCG